MTNTTQWLRKMLIKWDNQHKTILKGCESLRAMFKILMTLKIKLARALWCCIEAVKVICHASCLYKKGEKGVLKIVLQQSKIFLLTKS